MEMQANNNSKGLENQDESKSVSSRKKKDNTKSLDSQGVNGSTSMEKQDESSLKIVPSLLALGLIFLCATGWLYWLSINLPTIQDQDQDGNETTLQNNKSFELKFPRNLEDLNMVANYLQQYKKDHIIFVMVLFCSTYIFKQAFSIPGSFNMNLLGGALFGVWKAFPLCCLLTAIGATCCYLLSYTFGRALVMKYFSNKIESLRNKVQENLQGLFFFLLFLRLFPMSPGWFLNITSPFLGVPIVPFFFSMFIGLMPYNFICVQTGSVLSQITSLNDMFTTEVSLKMAGAAIVALLPGIFFRKFNKEKVQ